MEHVANGDYEMVGTFNGNPLSMAATRAMLYEVAHPDGLRGLDRLRDRAVTGLEVDHRQHTASPPTWSPSVPRGA